VTLYTAPAESQPNNVQLTYLYKFLVVRSVILTEIRL